MERKVEILKQVSQALSLGNTEGARETARLNYPFVPIIAAGRKYTEEDKTALFIRDGFIDRYTGERLVFPGALLLLSHFLPEELPYHPNWRADVCHSMYWEFYPSLDHRIPLARGGPNNMDNWMTTSGFHNAAKGNALLEEIGWTLHPAGSLHEWDGLLNWFMEQCERDPALPRIYRFGKWYRPARKLLRSLDQGF